MMALLLWSGGFVLKNMGKPNEAIDKYRKAVNINPKNCLVYSNWALILLNQNKKAIEKFETCIELSSGQFPDVEWRARKAIALLQKKIV